MCARMVNRSISLVMKVVPALAILAIIWILAHATVREFLVTGIVLALSSVFYFARAEFRRKA